MQVTGLFRYPVKSLKGVPVPSLSLDEAGAVDDRRWMVVDEAGAFLSQRALPQLSRLTPVLTAEALRLHAPDGAAVEVALAAPGPTRQVRVWKDDVEAVDCGESAAAFLSTAVGRRCRLVRFAEGARRQVDPQYAPARGALTRFTDGYPLLVATEASLAALNARLLRPVAMVRFRPNVVVDGEAPWAEDGWRALTVGAVTLDLVKPCVRCVVTTVDVDTGLAAEDGEPLKTLKALHSLPGRGPVFGQNAVHREKGTIALGDVVASAL